MSFVSQGTKSRFHHRSEDGWTHCVFPPSDPSHPQTKSPPEVLDWQTRASPFPGRRHWDPWRTEKAQQRQPTTRGLGGHSQNRHLLAWWWCTAHRNLASSMLLLSVLRRWSHSQTPWWGLFFVVDPQSEQAWTWHSDPQYRPCCPGHCTPCTPTHWGPYPHQAFCTSDHGFCMVLLFSRHLLGNVVFSPRMSCSIALLGSRPSPERHGRSVACHLLELWRWIFPCRRSRHPGCGRNRTARQTWVGQTDLR